MISVKEAETHILAHMQATPTDKVGLSEAHGRVLRETLRADRDFPPFDRVAMDGIALSSQQCAQGSRRFPIAFTHAAGAAARTLEDASHCAEVMTGAVLPKGADCVVPVERISCHEGVATLDEDVQPVALDNVHSAGSDRCTGDAVLHAGQHLYAPQLAVAATVGAAVISVAALPRIAIVSTGDELVDIQATPLPHQIRRSNVHAIEATLRLAGYTDICTQHLQDDAAAMRSALDELINTCDVLILSGGVSAGRFDHVPDVLRSLDVEIIFHKVSMRPGKPFLFGKSPKGAATFGLPGNPVSALVCLQRFVLPGLAATQGSETVPISERPRACLTQDVSFKKPLTLFKPVRFIDEGQGTHAQPVPMNGSADLAGLANSDGFIELAAEESHFPAGSQHSAWTWSGQNRS